MRTALAAAAFVIVALTGLPGIAQAHIIKPMVSDESVLVPVHSCDRWGYVKQCKRTGTGRILCGHKRVCLKAHLH
jgi:hypothetical protein